MPNERASEDSRKLVKQHVESHGDVIKWNKNTKGSIVELVKKGRAQFSLDFTLPCCTMPVSQLPNVRTLGHNVYLQNHHMVNFTIMIFFVCILFIHLGS